LGGVNTALADVGGAWSEDKEAVVMGGRFGNKGWAAGSDEPDADDSAPAMLDAWRSLS
jgi:hypothetical protein